MTRGFAERGINAVCVPMHVRAADLDDFVRGASRAQNVDGMIITVPHKQAAPRKFLRVIPSGSAAARALMASSDANEMPKGLPITSPNITPQRILCAEGEERSTSRATPVAEKANSGSIR